MSGHDGFYGRTFDDDGNLVYDPADPLAPVKEAVADADEETRPARAVRAIQAMARFGMDDGTWVTVRAYVKRHHLMPAPEFDRITKPRRRHLHSVSLPPANAAHLHTPPSEPPGIARDRDILRRMVVCTRVCMGLVGENRAAKLVYLAVTTRLFGEPVNVVAKGLSSSGKSYTVECVIALFPPEAVYTMTAMSERALIYLEEPLAHRTVVLFEAAALKENREKAEGNMAAYIVRSLLSEGRIEYPVVIRDDDGHLHTEKRVIPGPTNLVTTTTEVRLHAENETRMLSVPSNDSKAQTRAVMITSSDERKRQDADLGDWHDFQRWLAAGTREVVIPYARCVARQIPPDAVRLRRDWNTTRALIMAHALMHQQSRDRDDGGRIVASAEDYTAVRSLVNDLIAEAVGATVPASVRETVQLVDELHAATAEGYATTYEVAARLKVERSSAARRLNTARDRGYLVNAEDKKGRPARWVTGDPLPAEVQMLPPPEDICTGPCTHARNGDTAGQGCDCTGVCRCADDAEPRETEIVSSAVVPEPGDPEGCTVCGEPLDPALAQAGFGTHPGCEYPF